MNPSIPFKTTTLPFLIAFALTCFGPLPSTQALAPPPDGGYPGANTAEGTQALSSLSPQARGSGANNTALGYHTLFSNTTGSFNTATGYQALVHNTTGSDNTAIGYQAAFSNIGGFVAEGFYNTAIGSQALYSNSTGGNNTALGFQALFSLTGPYGDNTAIGFRALQNITTGYQNIALGENAGQDLTTGHNNIDIGNLGVDTDSRTIRIGDSNFQTATFIAGIYGTPLVGGAPVVVNSNGQLGIAAIASSTPSAPSSRRFRQEILRYEAMNTKLRGEFLKEHRTVQELKKNIAALTATVKEQAAQIQKVSAHFELTKPVPQIVVNDQ